jgi:hypothetical protein
MAMLPAVEHLGDEMVVVFEAARMCVPGLVDLLHAPFVGQQPAQELVSVIELGGILVPLGDQGLVNLEIRRVIHALAGGQVVVVDHVGPRRGCHECQNNDH